MDKLIADVDFLVTLLIIIIIYFICREIALFGIYIYIFIIYGQYIKINLNPNHMLVKIGILKSQTSQSISYII